MKRPRLHESTLPLFEWTPTRERKPAATARKDRFGQLEGYELREGGFYQFGQFDRGERYKRSDGSYVVEDGRTFNASPRVERRGPALIAAARARAAGLPPRSPEALAEDRQRAAKARTVRAWKEAHVTGNTREHKAALMALGGRWDRREKHWEISTEGDRAAQLLALPGLVLSRTYMTGNESAPLQVRT